MLAPDIAALQTAAMTRLYFAYGSNLLTQRLTARCPGARPLGRATLDGHRVAFAKLSTVDGSGKATILPAARQTAHGVLYALSDGDLATLDLIEGVGHGYHRLDSVAVRLDGAPLAASTYIACAPIAPINPLDWYLALIVAGARQHGLDAALVARYRRHRFDPDPQHRRPGRLAAVAALTAAGHADWAGLLGSPEPAAEPAAG
ncbi:gamma-glutamylcyclotransferase family protein [Halovulum marinum]|nr:gamma-glutamylcyclotransferase family protein [Halovulum marinum]